MIRTKGEAGTGDIVNAVTHMRAVFGGIRRLGSLRPEELYAEAKELRAPYELVRWVAENGRLPVVTFTAGGIATPADAALCMQLGADGVFVGSGIFKSGDPEKRAKAIVEATTHFDDAGDPRARVRAASASRWSASPPPSSPPKSCSRPAAGNARPAPGAPMRIRRVLRRARATSASTRRCCARLGAEVVEVRQARRSSTGSTGSSIPGGESTAITRLMRLYGLEEAIRALRRARLRHLRRDDPPRPRPPRPRRRRRRPERLRPPGGELRGRPRARGRRRAAARRLHPRAARARGRARRSRCWPSWTASRCCCGRAGSSSRRSIPS